MTEEAKNDTAEKTKNDTSAETEKALTTYHEGVSIPFDTRNGTMQIRTVGDIMFLAKVFAKTEMVPESYQGKPHEIFVAAITGFRVGFTDILMSLQSIAVVNGTPSIFGKGALGLVKSSGKLTKHVECFVLPDGKQVDHYNGPADLSEWPDELTAVCEMTREDNEPSKGIFSVADAKRMGKWNKTSQKGYRTVWMNHPLDMLMNRARHKVYNKDWTDVLCGLTQYEVAIDMEPLDEDGGSTGKSVTYVPKGDTYVPKDEVSTSDEQEQKVYSGNSDFEATFPADSFPLMDTFLELVSANSDQDIDVTKSEAMENVKDFGMMYGKWSATQKQAEEEQAQEEAPFQDVDTSGEVQENGNNKDYNPEETESSKEKPKVPKDEPATPDFYAKPTQGHSPFRQEWNLKNKKNFVNYVVKNKAKFEECSVHNPEDYEYAKKDKFERFYPDKTWPVFPIDKSLENPETLAEVKPGMIRLFTDSDDLSQEQKQYKMQYFYAEEFDAAIATLKWDPDNLGPSAINVIERGICDALKAKKGIE